MIPGETVLAVSSAFSDRCSFATWNRCQAGIRAQDSRLRHSFYFEDSDMMICLVTLLGDPARKLEQAILRRVKIGQEGGSGSCMETED